ARTRFRSETRTRRDVMISPGRAAMVARRIMPPSAGRLYGLPEGIIGIGIRSGIRVAHGDRQHTARNPRRQGFPEGHGRPGGPSSFEAVPTGPFAGIAGDAKSTRL